eukprot:6141547-Pleurochrysis_carterae.AAC.2
MAGSSCRPGTAFARRAEKVRTRSARAVALASAAAAAARQSERKRRGRYGWRKSGSAPSRLGPSLRNARKRIACEV